MRHNTSNAISKRCPNGKWKDDDGQCIPIEEWKAKHHRDSPKEKTDDSGVSVKTDSEQSARGYALSEEHTKALDEFFTKPKYNPITKSKEVIGTIDKALKSKMPINKVVSQIIGMNVSASQIGMSNLRAKDRATMLQGLRNFVSVCPFITNSLSSLSFNSYMGKQDYGNCSWWGVVQLSRPAFLEEADCEDLRANIRRREVKNIDGKDDMLSWSFSPENYDQMTDEEVIEYSLMNTLTHEMGHTVAMYLAGITQMLKDGEKYYTIDSAKRNIRLSSAEEVLDSQNNIVNEKLIGNCEAIYKELYGLDDDSFNPFDVYSEYGYYASGFEANNEKPAERKTLSYTVAEERIAEAFSDVCCRKNPNTMSKIIVSAVNYEIARKILDLEMDFHDYFFSDEMKEQREQMKSNRIIKSDKIEKKCPNGYHKAPDGCRRVIDGKPIGELYVADAKPSEKPKNEKDKQPPKNDTSERVSPVKRNYGLSKDARKNLDSFYVGLRDASPFDKSEKTIDAIDKALKDPSVPLDDVFALMCDEQSPSYSHLSDIENKNTRKALLGGLRNVLKICPYATVSVPSVGLEFMSDDRYGYSYAEGGAIYLNRGFYYCGTKNDDYRMTLYLETNPNNEVINPAGEKDTFSWRWSPRNIGQMSPNQLVDFARAETLAHEIGHSIGGYLENISMARVNFLSMYDDEKREQYKNLNLKDLYSVERDEIISEHIRSFKEELTDEFYRSGELDESKIEEFTDRMKEICEEYWHFDVSREDKSESYTLLEELENDIEKAGYGYISCTLPDSRTFYQYNRSDMTYGYNDYQYRVIDECLDVYKQLYNLTDETLNPFDIWTEYGYYGGYGQAERDKPSQKVDEDLEPEFSMARQTQTTERIAEAFADVSMRGSEANSMSVLIVSCVNYNIYKAICGTDVSFKDYFFGDEMKEQREQMKSNRIVKSDEAIEKKKCPEGQHAHPNYTICHDIKKPHRAGSKAEQEHFAMGLPNGDKQPDGTSGGGNEPKKEPEKPKEEPKKEEPKPKKEKSDEVKEYSEGVPKPEYMRKVTGFVRDNIEKASPEYYKDVTEKASKVSKAIRDLDWSKLKEGESVDSFVKPIKESFPEYAKYFPEFDKRRISGKSAEIICNALATCMDEYPWALQSFNGFYIKYTGANVGGYFCVQGGDVGSICLSDDNSGMKASLDSAEFGPAIDPVTMDRTDWGWHFSGATYGTSIMHEYGHLVDFTIRAMRYLIKLESNGYVDTDAEDEKQTFYEKFAHDNSWRMYHLDIDYDSYTWRGNTLLVGVDTAYNGYKTGLQNLKRNNGFEEVRIANNDPNITGINSRYVLKISLTDKQVKEIQPKDNPNAERVTWQQIREKYSDEELAKRMRNVYDDCDSGEENERAIERIKECEKLYKKIYNVDTIIPSECYSIYGYYGRAGMRWSGKKSQLRGLQAGERVADAFRDVQVRGEKANSMSQLIVAHIQYEAYQVISGDMNTSFEQFIKKNIGFDKFGERIIKMFNPYRIWDYEDDEIAKKKCPEGQHAHPNYTICHDITKPHRKGSKAEQEHFAMGLPNGDDEGPNKKEPEKPEKKKPKDKPKKEPKPKEEKPKDNEIVPWDKGMDKSEPMRYAMGYTRDGIQKANPELYEEATTMAKTYVDVIRKTDWSTGDANLIIDGMLGEIRTTTGNKQMDLRNGFDFSLYPKEVVKQMFDAFADVVEEFPLAILSFRGFADNSGGRGVEAYSPDNQTILFNNVYFGRDGSPFGTTENDKTYIDPITHEPVEDWYFHFNGSTYSNCVQHEFGHAIDFQLRYMNRMAHPYEEGLPKDLEYSVSDEQKEQIMSILKDYGLDADGEFEKKEFSDGTAFYLETNMMSVYGPQHRALMVDEVKKRMKAIKGVTSVYWHSWSNTITISVRGHRGEKFKKPKNTKIQPKFSEKTTNGQFKHYSPYEEAGMWRNDRRIKIDRYEENYSTKRIRECEEVYKKLYNVDKILPSECYSVYGYYGTNRFEDDKELEELKELQAGERTAEAFNDVMVRKDKANSMSQLIVAHTEFEYYQILSGDYSMTFEQFIIDKVGKDRFKDRIIKMVDMNRYIPYAIMKSNAIVKKCPDGYHITPDGCRRVIDGKPTGELYVDDMKERQSKPAKPKKQDPVLHPKVNKIVSPNSKEGRIVMAMKDGKSDEAQQSRKDYIKLVKEIGYYPVVIPTEKFKSYGKTFDGTRTTYDMFVNEDGTYDEARQRLHDQIIGRHLRKMKRRTGDKQIAMFLGGGSASGKGSMDSTLAKDFDVEDAKMLEDFKIDPDAIMMELPEYKKLPPELRASACHKEASDIAEMLFYEAMKNGVSFIYDGTFSSEKPVRFAQSVDKDKYQMLYRGVVAEPNDCVFFSNKRFVEGSGKDGIARLVPETVIRDTNKGAREIRKKYVKDTDLFDDKKLFAESKGRHKFYMENRDTYFE